MPGNNSEPKIKLATTCNWLKKTSSKSVFALKRFSRKMDKDNIRYVYFGIFQDHHSYAIIVWGSTRHAQDIFLIKVKLYELGLV